MLTRAALLLLLRFPVEGLTLVPSMKTPLPRLLLRLFEMETCLFGCSTKSWHASRLDAEADGQHEQTSLLDDPVVGDADGGDNSEGDTHGAMSGGYIEMGACAGCRWKRFGGDADVAFAAVVPRTQLASAGNEDTGSAVGDVEDVGAFAGDVALLLGCKGSPPRRQSLVVVLGHLADDSTPELASKLPSPISLSHAAGTFSVWLSTSGSSHHYQIFQEAAWQYSPTDCRGAHGAQSVPIPRHRSIRPSSGPGRDGSRIVLYIACLVVQAGAAQF
mmetsp:Transcript_22058/g.65329  ORF Transcript_22058/g.65329 Transcript_22058/m.65329 type:complete len:274 (+) Transcript_22058:314-1135(+)